MKYLSEEWVLEAKQYLCATFEPKQMNFVSASLLLVHLNCPERSQRGLLFRYEKGELQELSLHDQEQPETQFKLTGDYVTFCLLLQSDLNAQKAILEGRLVFQGNMVKGLKLAPLGDRLLKTLGKLQAEYGFPDEPDNAYNSSSQLPHSE